MQYTPLNYTEDEIRLLKVDVEHRNYELKSNISLRASKPQFVALSYTWGDQSQRESIEINGFAFPISSNLHRALEEVITYWRRTYASGNKSLLLWCDQICINQSHDEEKNHQVAFMRRIYERAEEVLIWLPVDVTIVEGKGKNDGKIAGNFATWSEWKDWHEKKLDFGPLQNSYQRQNPMLYAPATASAEGDTQPLSLAQLREVVQAWSNIHSIVQSPWWSRAWVYQEFILATRATFLIDGVFVPWREVHSLLSLVLSNLESQLMSTKERSARVDTMALDADDRLRRLDNHEANLRREKEQSYWDSAGDCFQDWLEWNVGILRKALRVPGDWCSVLNHPINDEKVDFAVGLIIFCAPIAGTFFLLSMFLLVPLLGFLYITFASVSFCRERNQNSAEKKLYSIYKDSYVAARHAYDVQEARELLKAHATRLEDIRRSWDLVHFIFKSKANLTRMSDNIALSTLIEHARNTFCADPRDKIFAFIGLAEPRYGIKADYDHRNTSHSTVVEAAVAIIKIEETLNILTWTTQDRGIPFGNADYLPSWVPDILNPLNPNSEHETFLRSANVAVSDFKASQSRKPIVSFSPNRHGEKDRVLEAKGIRIDFLVSLVEDNPYEPRRRFRGSSSTREIVTRSTAREGDEVWVLLGLDAPLTLSQPSQRDPYYTIIGHALLYDDGKPSDVLYGSLMERLDAHEIELETVSII